MHAFIRRYRMGRGSIDDLMHRVDTLFASQISGERSPADGAPVDVPEGIVSYHAVDTGDGTIVTITLFETEAQSLRAQQAARDIRTSLADFEVEELDTHLGQVMVSRAGASVLTPIRP